MSRVTPEISISHWVNPCRVLLVRKYEWLAGAGDESALFEAARDINLSFKVGERGEWFKNAKG